LHDYIYAPLSTTLIYGSRSNKTCIQMNVEAKRNMHLPRDKGYDIVQSCYKT
jgi:hypothetical protein